MQPPPAGVDLARPQTLAHGAGTTMPEPQSERETLQRVRMSGSKDGKLEKI